MFPHRAGEDLPFDWCKITASRAADAEDEEEEEEINVDDDPYGFNNLTSVWQPARIGPPPRPSADPAAVLPGHYCILRSGSSDSNDTSSFTVEGLDVPLWLCKVLDVIKDEDGQAVRWRVRWWSSYGKGELAKFRFLDGNQYIEELNVDVTFLVTATPNLNKDNSIPAKVRAAAAKAVRSALIAEENGNVGCVACGEDLPDEEMLACGACGQHYHARCAGDTDVHDWWCTSCHADNA